jgi:hypothetical protein
MAVERVIVWPGLECDSAPEVYGRPLAPPPHPQQAPAKGTGPRINHRRAARRAAKLPNVLLAWVGSDGFPFVSPVDVVETERHGIVLDVPSGVAVPPGGRRAGLLAHSFARYTFGQNQRKHTGWMEGDPRQRRAVYAPHTEGGYWLPASRPLYRLSAGVVTRRGLRAARDAGFVST